MEITHRLTLTHIGCRNNTKFLKKKMKVFLFADFDNFAGFPTPGGASRLTFKTSNNDCT